MVTEDFQHTSEDQGVLVLAVRRDSDGQLTQPDGNFSALLVDASGRLKVVGELTGGSGSGPSVVSLDEDTLAALETITVGTELPNAEVLSDTLNNPTTSIIGACQLIWDSSHWRRIWAGNPNSDNFPLDLVPLPGNISVPFWFDGVAFDRARGDSVNGLDVDVTRMPAGPTTGTNTSEANTIAAKTLLAANANRKGATIYNDDTLTTGASLKVKLGAGASASSFTCNIPPGGYYEVPFGYTGIVDGIASAATGNAKITELT